MTEPVLLDTCAILYLAEDVMATPEVKASVEGAANANRLFVSPVSAWEIGRLAAAGKLALRIEPFTYFQRFLSLTGSHLADMGPEVLVASSFLPGHFHKDPMDRVLVETARRFDCTLVTRDHAILAYGKDGHVKTLAC
jgi:PIN domain nuclease of toxin-antitoxin system